MCSPAACDTDIQNGTLWLKAVMHTYCCNKHSCQHSFCSSVRDLLVYSHTVPPCHQSGQLASIVHPLRQLQAHYVQCRDINCALCSPVYRQLSDGKAQGSCDPPGAAVDTALSHSPKQQQQAQAVLSSSHRVGVALEDQSAECWGMESGGAQEFCSEDEDDDDSSSGWGDAETENMDDMDPEAVRLSSCEDKDSCIYPCCNSNSSSATVYSSEESFSTAPVAQQLVAFAHFLLHSFLRWPAVHATTTQVCTHTQACSCMPARTNDLLTVGRGLWGHLCRGCQRTSDCCSYPGCNQARQVLLHLLQCQDTTCPVCNPITKAFAAASPQAASMPGLKEDVPAEGYTKHNSLTDWIEELTGALQHLQM